MAAAAGGGSEGAAQRLEASSNTFVLIGANCGRQRRRRIAALSLTRVGAKVGTSSICSHVMQGLWGRGERDASDA